VAWERGQLRCRCRLPPCSSSPSSYLPLRFLLLYLLLLLLCVCRLATPMRQPLKACTGAALPTGPSSPAPHRHRGAGEVRPRSVGAAAGLAPCRHSEANAAALLCGERRCRPAPPQVPRRVPAHQGVSRLWTSMSISATASPAPRPYHQGASRPRRCAAGGTVRVMSMSTMSRGRHGTALLAARVHGPWRKSSSR